MSGAASGAESAPGPGGQEAAVNYGETLAALGTYAASNRKRMIQLGPNEGFWAASLPPEEEYGAQDGDVSLGLTMHVLIDPKSLRPTYELTLYHDRPDGAEPLESESTTYPGVPSEGDLDGYDEDIAREWLLLLYAATASKLFKKQEAWFRLPDGHTSKLARQAAQGDAAAQVAVAAWLKAQDTPPQPGAEDATGD